MAPKRRAKSSSKNRRGREGKKEGKRKKGQRDRKCCKFAKEIFGKELYCSLV